MTREVSDSVREVQEETVSDVIHVLAAVHNHPVAFMNKLDAKCSLTPMSMHTHRNSCTHRVLVDSLRSEKLQTKKIKIKNKTHPPHYTV